MPNRRTHIAIAFPVGAIAAGYKANCLNGLPFLWEVVGGGLGAAAGGIWPDVIDPPTDPNHRCAGHALVPAVTAGRVALGWVDVWQNSLRQEADRIRQLQLLAGDPLLRLVYGAWEIAIRLLAGALVGFMAGWGSHLVLDFGTARSIPLLY